MSLPPGFLDELRGRLSLAQVVGRKVVWDRKRSNPAKGDLWAPCPFHQERTASFHVDDRKGFYYCFGCHAKGDALTFVKETENVGFMEAVEILAREAGLAMPARDPQAVHKADRRTRLADVMEAAVQHFRLQLRSAAGAAARDYLAGRRLSQAAQDRFDLGFAPDARTGLFAALTAKGIAADLIVDAGLAIRPDDGGAPYDRFRGRIIFPIRDARGRCIALGGRAMDPNARAKYLNSPETELFDKGRTLYNLGPAREAAGRGAPLIVAEGYMDVIALVEAGFGGAVAPLGTAVTEDQLRLMWRLHPEPVIALDGDAAGIRAALRVIDLALPVIEAGQGLRFAVMPAGMDPDDLIRAEGPTAVQRVLEAARPMAALVWQRETEGLSVDSPERRATLDKRLRALLGTIRDRSIREHYAQEFRRLRAELFGTAPRPYRGKGAGAGGRGGPQGRGAGPPAPATPSAKASLLAAAPGERTDERLREAAILAVLCLHPALVVRFEAGLARMETIVPEHEALLRLLLRLAGDPAAAETLRAEAAGRVETLLGQSHIRTIPAIQRPDDEGLAAMTVAEELARLDAHRSARREIEDAMHDMAGLADEGLTWRVTRAAEAVRRVGRLKDDDENDLGEDRAALSQRLQALIDGEVWVKKRG
jgi:DNA primase